MVWLNHTLYPRSSIDAHSSVHVYILLTHTNIYKLLISLLQGIKKWDIWVKGMHILYITIQLQTLLSKKHSQKAIK